MAQGPACRRHTPAPREGPCRPSTSSRLHATGMATWPTRERQVAARSRQNPQLWTRRGNASRGRLTGGSTDPAGIQRTQLQHGPPQDRARATGPECVPRDMTDIAIDAIPPQRLHNAMQFIQQTQHAILANHRRRTCARHRLRRSAQTASQHRKAAAYVCKSRLQVFPQGLMDRPQ